MGRPICGIVLVADGEQDRVDVEGGGGVGGAGGGAAVGLEDEVVFGNDHLGDAAFGVGHEGFWRRQEAEREVRWNRGEFRIARCGKCWAMIFSGETS